MTDTRNLATATRLETWQDARRIPAAYTVDAPDTFDWWYFDVTLNDGRALVVAFLIEPDAAHGRFKYQTSIYLASLDRPPIKGEHHTYDDVVISTERPDVRIGESWLRGNLDTYGLVVDPGSHGGLGLDATIERVVPSRVSPASTDIVVGGERGLGWVNPIPSGTLAGSPQCKRSSPPIG